MWLKQACSFSNSYFVVVVLSASIEQNQQITDK
jgi:hypothetical protein